eukprot:g34760.t1
MLELHRALVWPHLEYCEQFWSLPYQKGVESLERTLDTAKASGHDNIPALVLKTCAPELVTPLAKLLQYSYNTGIYPTMWKIA